jgi:hypothetical protein
MVARATDGIGGSLEYELEGEFEEEYEGEYEGEEFLGTLARGVGSLLGANEFEEEYEGEYELEYEGEYELEGEWEGEYEGEEFFRRIARLARRAAPILGRVARIAAPMVGTAVGGPLGGMLARAATSALREGEYELEGEYEHEYEYEGEGELEAVLAAPVTPQQAQAEWMAAVASQAQTEAEAEAMAGAATIAALSPADRAALQRILPHMVRGTAILTRVLRRQRATRPAIRAIPTIVRGTATTLRRQRVAGRPITRATAARAMATQTRRVLTNPRLCTAAIQRNARAASVAGRQARRPAMRPVRG